MKVVGSLDAREVEEDFINVNPLQTGGRATLAARRAIAVYIDGYSVCDWCKGALPITDKPSIQSTLEEVSEFLGMHTTLPTNGCREAKQAVMASLCEKGDAVVVDGNKHYSTYVAAESLGLQVFDVPSSGHPEFKINPEDYAEVIEQVKRETGTLPKLAVLTHVDGSYGNVVDAEKTAKIVHEFEVPLLLNTAYSSGRMPVEGGRLGVDFIAASCHKSWAVGGGNMGLLSVSQDWVEETLPYSEKYKIKPLPILGCSTRGSAMVAFIASFPHVRERVERWDKEVEHARFVMKKLDEVGITQVGETPTNHDVNFVESDVLYQISQTHKKKNYFLYHELKKRGVFGIKAGLTKNFKFSTYGKTDEQIKILSDAFADIVATFS